MNHRALVLLVALALLPLAGCVENMSDLRNRLDSQNVDGGVDTNATGNSTIDTNTSVEENPLPVARADVFQKGGAKVHQSDFMAEDGQVGMPLTGGVEMSFVASNSEALDPTASITSFAWDFGDGTTAEGSTATHAFPEDGGVFVVTLTVMDSANRTDTQVLKVGVQPAPVTVTTDASGTLVAGTFGSANEEGVDQATTAFDIVSGEGDVDYEHVKTVVTLSPGSEGAADMSLAVRNETDTLDSSNGAGPNEQIELTGLDAGAYAAVVTLTLGVQGDYVLVIETTYQPVNHDVMEMFGGHGDGHAHSH